MNVVDEKTVSLWMDGPRVDAPRLDRADRADVIVIGAGIAGLSAAYELAARGRSVIVVDSGAVATGMTARTTAHLASDWDDSYAQLIKTRDPETAKLLYQSLAAAIDRAEAIIRAEQIDCDFQRLDGYLVPTAETPDSALDEEVKACAQVGMPVVDTQERTP